MGKNPSQLTELTFHLIVESSPSAIVLVNEGGKIVYVNSQCEKLFGYTKAELISHTVEMLIPQRFSKRHPDFRKMFFEKPSVKAMGAGRELFAARKDGSEFPIEIGLNPLVTVEGTLVLASIIDITERKKAEEQFRLVVNSAPNAMVLVNEEGDISLVNDEAQKLFGYHANEMIGNHLEMLIPKRFHSGHQKFRKDFFLTPKTRSMGAGRDLFGLRKDGKEIPIEIGLNPIETQEGLMVLASVIDITERKIREEAVKKQVELEIRNKELEQFAYVASHDLKEPIRTILNFTKIFEEDYGQVLDEMGKKYLHIINEASTRMGELVKALLDYSRLGRKKLEHSDLNRLLKETITDLGQAIESSGAKIDIEEMPTLYIYETEMRQLFQNLISNAIKFRKKGTKPEISITARQRNGKWQFSVQDNGIGIAPQHFERIFQVFQRLHKDGEYDGYGVGLPNCKKIVELHNGDIWVESAPGKGATFNFTIPKLLKNEQEG